MYVGRKMNRETLIPNKHGEQKRPTDNIPLNSIFKKELAINA